MSESTGGIFEFTPDNINTPEGITELNRVLNYLNTEVPSDGVDRKIIQGYGSPEGSVVAGIGSQFMRLDGGSSTSLYIKESGSGATGWTAK